MFPLLEMLLDNNKEKLLRENERVNGYGFMRTIGASTSSSDVYVSQSQIRRFGLRSGDDIYGEVRPPKDGERYFGLVKVEKINGADPDSVKNGLRDTISCSRAPKPSSESFPLRKFEEKHCYPKSRCSPYLVAVSVTVFQLFFLLKTPRSLRHTQKPANLAD